MNRFLTTLMASCCAATAGATEVVYQTNDPFGGFLGINGFDVFESQSVAVRFTPDGDFFLQQFRVWLWNNDDTGGTPAITFSLRYDDPSNGESRPSGDVLESWSMNMSNTGVFEPVEFAFYANAYGEYLESGTRYWVVAESAAPAGLDPVWAWAANDAGVCTNTDSQTGEWYPAPETGAVSTLTVIGWRDTGVIGDIDGDGHVTLSDLTLMLSAFGSVSNQPNYIPLADLAFDGIIDITDFAQFLPHFGT